MKKTLKLAQILLGLSFLGTAMPANTNSTIMEKTLEEKAIGSFVNEQPELERNYSHSEISQILRDVYRLTPRKPAYLSEKFIKEIISHESSFNPMAVSGKGAKGLMQLMPETWNDIEKNRKYEDGVFDPKLNVLVGIKHLLWLDRRFRKDYQGWEDLTTMEKREMILSAYNAGLSRLQKEEHQLENMPKETRNYVEKIVGKAGQLR